VALSRAQHLLEQALSAFVLQVLIQAVSQFASEPPEGSKESLQF
jgi:hypothetical protein